ncbi:ABC transporter substrate-binding protein [uncultured Dialister sp.]|jgi:iron complex transport system substrate-binding protein|uniref:ABC transporter substrate-binding protein n=1 Tax=uncultured Dialister sp. TaxID=278064 RepID=UPI0025E82FB3|nr:ABC transporter substrate-binding protein [uncultured Dialister sp.]
MKKLSIKYMSAALSAVMAISLFSACAPVVKEGASSSPAEIASEGRFPVTVSSLNSKGEMEEETFTKPPERVVAVWQNSIETLLALGVGDRIMAGMGIPDAKYLRPEYREAYEKIPYRSLENLDLETVTMMDPDFIVGWASTFSPKVLRDTDYWHGRGVHTYISADSSAKEPVKTVENEYRDILNMGRIFGRSERAEEIVQHMKDEIGRAEETARKTGRHPRALILERQGKSLTVYGEKTLAGNILKAMGGELLQPSSRDISREELIDLNPDALFLVVIESDYERTDEVLSYFYEDEALQNVDCIRNRNIHVLPLYAVYSAGVRMSDGIELVGKGLYGEDW